MRNVLRITVLILLLLPHPSDAFLIRSSVGCGQLVIASEPESLTPGGIMKITLTAPVPAAATALFAGDRFPFTAAGNDGHLFTLIGLGLESGPGTADLVIDVELDDGTRKRFPLQVRIADRHFPQKRLRVRKEYVSPPPEVQERIERERELTGRAYENPSPDWLCRGNFMQPVKGRITGTFGDRRTYNDGYESRHRGIDIAARRGTAVAATNGGIVVLTHDLYFSGNTVIIDHGAGLFSIYCHLNKTAVSTGKRVAKGDIIGYVGSTGRATGPHLHWGIKLRGAHVDPASLLALTFE